MFATYRKDGGRSHSWEFEEYAKQTDEGVEFDGYLVEDATLEKVQSKEVYINGDGD